MQCPRLGYYDKVYQGNTGTHVASIYVNRDNSVEFNCSCGYNLFTGKICKHLKDLLKEVDEVYKINVNKGIREFDSSIETIPELLQDKAYNDNQLLSIYARAGKGKTLFVLQEATYFLSQGYNVLIIDTEGSLNKMISAWGDIFEERFGEGKGELFVEIHQKVPSLLKFLGYDGRFIPPKKKGGKFTFSYTKDASSENKLTPIELLVKKNKIDFVILDSLTSALEDVPTTSQNFPARADCTKLILREINRVMNDYNVGAMVTHHTSWNPMDTLSKESDNMIVGGKAVKHYSKSIIYMDMRQHMGKIKDDVKNYRRFWLVRAPNFPDWSRASVARIDDTGFHYVKMGSEEYKKCFNNGELLRLGIK